ncbi:MAG: hypothetical protein V1492_02560 [Candidatus Micrarchaeota archaeon]
MIGSIFDSLLGKKKEVKKEQVERKTSDKVELRGKMKNAAKLKKALAAIPVFDSVQVSKDTVSAMIVESTDKQKNPYRYINFLFSPNGVEVFYTMPPEVVNPVKRELEVMKTAFTVISLLENEEVFLPNREDLYTKAAEAFDRSLSLLGSNVLRVKYELGRSNTENIALKTEAASLKEAKAGLNHQLMELEKKIQQLEERIKHLEGLTDAELDREVVKWVEEHNGKLNDARFCASFNIAGQRLEERLDVLSKTGVIRIV